MICMCICCCRKNHQRALDSMQASLEAEARGKAEAMRIKKKLEQDINELEVALDGANRGRSDAEKNIKRYMLQAQELQRALEEEQRARDEAREQYQVIPCQTLSYPVYIREPWRRSSGQGTRPGSSTRYIPCYTLCRSESPGGAAESEGQGQGTYPVIPCHTLSYPAQVREPRMMSRQ